MDKTAKALTRLTKKEREAVRLVLEKLEAGDMHGLDMKKLIGRQDIFRVRKGNIRIIFQRTKTSSLFVLAIERRSDATYRKY